MCLGTSLKAGKCSTLSGISQFLVRDIIFFVRYILTVPLIKGSRSGGHTPHFGGRLIFLVRPASGHVRISGILKISGAKQSWNYYIFGFFVVSFKVKRRKCRVVVNLKHQKTLAKRNRKDGKYAVFRVVTGEGRPTYVVHVIGGYRHMYSHPSMRKSFLLCYYGLYFRCIALPF